ncbi:MAG: hypothetical protein ACYTG6_10445, partial [Planctomycetota bacterium]
LGEGKLEHDGFTIEIRSSREAERTTHVDNLIIEAYVEREIRRQDGGATGQRVRYSLGYLPAVPYEIRR